MPVFEWILVLLLGAVALSALARKLGVPYPALLAVGGAMVALTPGSPRLSLDPELILALFVAPVLLDAAYDASWRDLKDNWRPVTSLVLAAVGLTTLGVALVVHALVPAMPWAAAIVLGAIVAPPDAVAALAVLRAIHPPHRILKVLEGESLLNDASALLIYKVAVAASVGGFSLTHAAPTFAGVAVGSVIAGLGLARLSHPVLAMIQDPPSSVIVQFVTTFGVWIAAEHLGLSGVITIVCYGLASAWRPGEPMSPRLRIPSFAVWETATLVLNVLAFTLIGLQLGPILETLTPARRLDYLGVALAVLATVIGVRIAWVMSYNSAIRLKNRLFGARLARRGMAIPTARGGLLVSWCGMRGIVSLAAALGLPQDFPFRDLILLTAFTVVLGTLVIQGLTLKPLLSALKLDPEDPVPGELKLAQERALEAALAAIQGETEPWADGLRREYAAALARTRAGAAPGDSMENLLRQRMVAASRAAIAQLRRQGQIGDDAFRQLEEEYDWLELSAR
ncbi:sodium:proton antiporter [Caulobacter sp. CCNWLY153]|uniref:Sodium:proton antiporter n=1 Tax=Caulobacter radicis TaxID=2172650 RepID=A0A2T9JM51_9CAUL|nr:sodium:proton antiporter [Caulobacter radicis]PVM84775.1 sodium:proton antiporter [Caulobacter radicis]